MLDKTRFANSLAITTALLVIVFYLLLVLAPGVFTYVYNAQFLGADVAQFFPATPSLSDFIGMLVTIVITAWVASYIWAWLYNFLKK